MAELSAMPAAEFVAWNAYYAVQAQREELEALKAKGR